MDGVGAYREVGIPAIKMADGPLGVRSWAGSSAITSSANAPVKVETTSFPSGVDMAATWDTALVEREGQAIAEEVKALGRDMILGPTVNINRVPLWGRNFEGYGEDPYLRDDSASLTSKACRAKASSLQSSTLTPTTRNSTPPHRRDDQRASTSRDLSARL